SAVRCGGAGPGADDLEGCRWLHLLTGDSVANTAEFAKDLRIACSTPHAVTAASLRATVVLAGLDASGADQVTPIYATGNSYNGYAFGAQLDFGPLATPACAGGARPSTTTTYTWTLSVGGVGFVIPGQSAQTVLLRDAIQACDLAACAAVSFDNTIYDLAFTALVYAQCPSAGGASNSASGAASARVQFADQPVQAVLEGPTQVGVDNTLRLYGGDSTDPDRPGARLSIIWFAPTHLELACEAQSALRASLAASFASPSYEVAGSALGLGESVGYEMLVLDGTELAQLQAAGVAADAACAADRGAPVAAPDAARSCRWLWLFVGQPSDRPAEAWLASRCSTTHSVEVLSGARPTVRLDARQAPPGLSERALNTANQRATITPVPSALIRLGGAVSFENNALEYTSTFRAYTAGAGGAFDVPAPVLLGGGAAAAPSA
ncbi:MAG: hypothetical protein VX747_05955, partial [Actinomycetota bacterium]|nr:hypothetical protein [Actinomycetota bacterium]